MFKSGKFCSLTFCFPKHFFQALGALGSLVQQQSERLVLSSSCFAVASSSAGPVFALGRVRSLVLPLRPAGPEAGRPPGPRTPSALPRPPPRPAGCPGAPAWGRLLSARPPGTAGVRWDRPVPCPLSGSPTCWDPTTETCLAKLPGTERRRLLQSEALTGPPSPWGSGVSQAWPERGRLPGGTRPPRPLDGRPSPRIPRPPRRPKDAGRAVAQDLPKLNGVLEVLGRPEVAVSLHFSNTLQAPGVSVEASEFCFYFQILSDGSRYFSHLTWIKMRFLLGADVSNNISIPFKSSRAVVTWKSTISASGPPHTAAVRVGNI